MCSNDQFPYILSYLSIKKFHFLIFTFILGLVKWNCKDVELFGKIFFFFLSV